MVYVKAGRKVENLSDDVLEKLGKLSLDIETYKDDEEKDDDYGESLAKPVFVTLSHATDNHQVDLNDIVVEDTKIEAADLNALIAWSNSSTPTVTKGIHPVLVMTNRR